MTSYSSLLSDGRAEGTQLVWIRAHALKWMGKFLRGVLLRKFQKLVFFELLHLFLTFIFNNEKDFSEEFEMLLYTAATRGNECGNVGHEIRGSRQHHEVQKDTSPVPERNAMVRGQGQFRERVKLHYSGKDTKRN